MNWLIFFELLKQDLRQKYLGSLLGVVWAFLNPIATILVMWVVFQYGFKRDNIDGYPYALWFVAGILPWFYFADTITQATYAIKQKSYLIKKTLFEPIYLPIIRILSNIVIHIVLVIFMFVLYKVYGYSFSIYNLQIFYYIFCLLFLVYSLSLITSSLILFLPDIGEIVTLFVRFGFWITPIFWSANIIPSQYRDLLYFNPMYYIIEGFRDSLLYHRWFFYKESSLIFWMIVLSLFFIGRIVFKRLKPHFGDVI